VHSTHPTNCDAVNTNNGALINVRFRVAHLLVATALIAVGTCAVHDAIALSRARDNFEVVRAYVEAGRREIADIAVPAREFFECESDALWISRRKAKNNYVRTMTDIIANEEHGYWLRCSPEALDARKEQVATLKRQLQEVINEEG
jgi:hypothetical protein